MYCCTATVCTADVQLPYSRNPISEAVNSLLHRAGMMTSYPSTLQSQAPFGKRTVSMCGEHTENTL
jgi:hypothetical protein